MLITKTYKQKLYRCQKKTNHIDGLTTIARNIYNHCIALHRRYYRLYKKSLNIYQLQKHITKLKKRDKKYWCNLNSQAIQDITERIDKAYKLFFQERKKGNKTISLPSFKGKERFRSFTLKQTGWKLSDDNIQIQGKKYKLTKDRIIQGKIKTITVKKDNLGDYWITVSVQEEIKPTMQRTGKSVGLDFGLKTFLTTSDLEKIPSPEFLKSDLTRLRKLSKGLSKKIKGSNNRKKARLTLSRLHQSINNKRNAWQWNIAHKLVEKYDVISVESLNIKSMQVLWGRKISDLAISDFYNKLRYLCLIQGKTFVEINKWFPSSKKCHSCTYINQDLSLKNRTWVCPQCGKEHDRDENAAINIEIEGTSSIRLAGIRLPSKVAVCA